MNGNGMISKNQPENNLQRRSGKARSLAILTTLVGLASASWAWEDTPPAATQPQGLSGILGAGVPDNLSAEAFSNLGPTWAEWSTGAATAVAELYQSAGSDLAAQQKALATAKSKLKVIDTAAKDAKYAKISIPLAGLSGALSRRIDVSEAILETLSQDATIEYPKRLKAKSDGVIAAVDGLRKSLDKISGGSAWLPFVKADELVKALSYEGGGDGAVAAAKVTQAKLASRKTIEKADQKAFLNRPAFLALESAVNQYLITAENPPTPELAAKLREQLTALVAGLEAYEAEGLTAGATQVRQAYAAIRKLAADGGDKISAVLQKHYFNYNVRFVSSEDFLARLLADSRTEQGQVSDFVLGANVGGYQTTNTTIQVDLRPSKTDARWDLILNGNIQSNTQGVTSQATIYTAGNHAFRASKEVRFDGTTFKTSPGTISVNANNTTTGVATQFSRVPLFGGIADNIARGEAENRRGEAQAIASSRIQDRVLPRFNQEVNDAFVKAERDLQKDMFDHLRETGLYPDAMQFQTTDQELRASTRLMAETELGASLAPTQFVARTGATMLMHETEMNNGADRIGLAGKTLTDDEFRAELENFFSKAFNQKFTIEKPPEPAPVEGEEDGGKPPSTFVFASTDPIRIRLQDGVLALTLRTGFKKDTGEEIPQQIITVPMSFEVKGDKIQITRGQVRVAAAEGGGAGNIATAGVIRRKIQNSFPERVVEGKFKIQGTRNVVNATVTNIRIVDGWAVVNVK